MTYLLLLPRGNNAHITSLGTTRAKPECLCPESALSVDRDAALRVMNAISIVQSAAPLLMRGMAQDLLHLVFHGSDPQAATALQLAAAAYKHMDAPLMTGGDRETVRAQSPTPAQGAVDK